MFAARSACAGEVVLSIPLDICLTDRLIGSKIGPPYDGASWQATLAAGLAEEMARGRESRWAGWLPLLPTEPQGLALSDDILNELQYPVAVSLVCRSREERRDVARLLASHAPHVWNKLGACQEPEDDGSARASFPGTADGAHLCPTATLAADVALQLVDTRAFAIEVEPGGAPGLACAGATPQAIK